MKKKYRKNQKELLEIYSIALENVGKQEEIAAFMSELGYDNSVIDEGRRLLENTKSIFERKIAAEADISVAYKKFKTNRDKLDKIYVLHRKKARIIFKNEAVILATLRIRRRAPRDYLSWISDIKNFYNEIAKSSDLQQRMTKLNTLPAEYSSALKLVEKVEAAKADYINEKGESQNTREKKDDALKKLKDWMDDFYAVAKIALADSPQLQESLNKIVRS